MMARGTETCDGIRVKGRDCWWTVLVIDPIAGPLVRAVRRVAWVTPNRLTAASVAVALAAAAAYALDQLVAGALLFQLSFLIDCMDGKLAQTRGMRNRYGSYLDGAGDAIRFAACTGGLVGALAAHGAITAGWVTVLAMFPTLHYVRLTTQNAWPDRPGGDWVTLPASPGALLRSAPGRLSKPATTVDTEALAFTIGPLVGLPLAGILVAAAVDGARLVVSLAIRVRRSTVDSSERQLATDEAPGRMAAPRRKLAGGPLPHWTAGARGDIHLEQQAAGER
jgi:phosphatidylglycerophosphate synthase